MTTQNVPLSDHGREYVAAVVESGEAKDAAEVVDFALRKMDADRRAHEAKVETRGRESCQVQTQIEFTLYGAIRAAGNGRRFAPGGSS